MRTISTETFDITKVSKQQANCLSLYKQQSQIAGQLFISLIFMMNKRAERLWRHGNTAPNWHAFDRFVS